ncbi:hypothetical protein F2Q70_00034056 [Brassica cretica]|uniref:Nuclear pore complex protein Nup85 n=1 Tax=Brassica cretica TaxID=69181 RepID=A0A8S9JTX0_BRACR|nr:hypothetical protein F2Q68_00028994 [Brassica cretica]KAF2586010.1 hypothetical protein F2Q70_00034056 [Brassica cretica]
MRAGWSRVTSLSNPFTQALPFHFHVSRTVVLAVCSKEFGSWMVAHAMELLTAGSEEGEVLVHEEQRNLGGINMEELHRLVYAQVLSSRALTWQIAPVYLSSCEKQGLGLLELLFYRQPVQDNQLLIKSLEICRLYELGYVSTKLMKQARDEHCLKVISQQLFDSVRKSLSDESLKQWEGLVELLGSESQISGGLDFLHKYRDFKRSLDLVKDGKAIDAAHEAVERLLKLLIKLNSQDMAVFINEKLNRKVVLRRMNCSQRT